jgi:hypothetical protein
MKFRTLLYIPKKLQNTLFGLLFFAPVASKKTDSRAGYYSFFSKQQAQKSSRPKPSILKYLGYVAILLMSGGACAESRLAEDILQPIEPKVGSWTFSGMVTNESGDKYGYFFEMQKQGSSFHSKSALIDGKTNKLVFFYEDDEVIMHSNPLNWHVGRSYIRYNPINDSWIFGVEPVEKKGFNFRVDMLKHVNPGNETQELRPGVELQALQTSHLNGHVQTGNGIDEQFVTGNNTWFSKLRFTQDQKTAHDISATFCRLANDSGFYSANLKESDATGASVSGWRDATGNPMKMSQFISVKPLKADECLLSLALPKMHLKLFNTLQNEEKTNHLIAGFSEDKAKDFCFMTEQSFAQYLKEDKVTG